MLKMIDIDIENALAFQISGKITKGDMSTVLSHAKAKIEHNGRIVIFEKIISFRGIEVAAVIEEFKYLFDVGVSNITKAAILTDKKWIEHIVSIEDAIFKNIRLKCFQLDEQEKALDFLRQA